MRRPLRRLRTAVAPAPTSLTPPSSDPCPSSCSTPRSGRDLVNMAKKRPNVIPIIEDARHPQKYRMLVPMVDVVFADVAQPDQVRLARWLAGHIAVGRPLCRSAVQLAAGGVVSGARGAKSERSSGLAAMHALDTLAAAAPSLTLCTPWHPAALYHQARIVGLNSQYFLKNGGFFVISIKASCIDSTAPPEAVFAREVKKLQEQQLKPKEQVRWGRAGGAGSCCCWPLGGQASCCCWL